MILVWLFILSKLFILPKLAENCFERFIILNEPEQSSL